MMTIPAVGTSRAYPPMVRPAAMDSGDLVLRGGRVLDPGGDAETAAIVELNDRVVADDRVDAVMIPLADGLTLARRLP